MEDSDKILGDCDCPEGPATRSFKYPDASYLHVETVKGVRCCRKVEGGEIFYGSVISQSKSERATRKTRDNAIHEKALKAKAQKEDRKKAVDLLKKKRASNDDMSQEDLNILVDALLSKA